MTRIEQVKVYNALVDVYGMNKLYYMTTNNGRSLCQKGWVVFQSPEMGDQHDFAKWYPNKQQAELELKARV